MARAYLMMLDPAAKSHTFQTFDDVRLPDGKPRGDRSLAHIFHGPLDDAMAARLAELNRLGAGIYVTINATDGKGRTNENIRRVRAVWIDWDGKDGKPRVVVPPLPASVIVETSPGHTNELWLVDELMPAEHAGIMQTMVEKFGSDPNAKDLARVLRLPGFYHCKDANNRHRVWVCGGTEWPAGFGTAERCYTRAQMLQAFGYVAKPAPEPKPPREPGTFESARLSDALKHIPAADRDTWLRVGLALHDESAGSAEGFDLWSEWSETAPEKFDADDQDRTWQSFDGKSVRPVTIGTIFKMTKDGGWTHRPELPFEEIEPPPGAEQEDTAPDMSVLDIIRAPAPPLPLDCFGSFAPWLRVAAEAKSCPVDYPAVNLLTAVAGAIGSQRGVLHGDWPEPAVLWTAAIGGSADGKSPGADAVMGPLREAEKGLRAGYAHALAQYERDKSAAAVALERWAQAVADAKAKGLPAPDKPPEALEPMEPKRRQLIVGDATTEAIAQLMADNPHGLVQVCDELSQALDFDRYSGGASNRAFMLQAHGGRPYTVNRKSNPEPIEIPHCLMSIAGNLVPEHLDRLIDVNDGMFARYAMTWPDQQPLTRSGPISDGARLARVLVKLLNLGFPTSLPLTAEAADALHPWRVKNQAQVREALEGFHASALGKHPGLVLRLALLLKHLWWSDSPDTMPPTVLGLPELTAAMRLADDYFAPMLRRVLGEKSNTPLDRAARALARAIRARGAARINVREIKRKWHVAGLKPEMVDAACFALAEARWLTPITAQRNNTGGMPSKNWYVDPRVHDK
jgi:hypothetical protein